MGDTDRFVMLSVLGSRAVREGGSRASPDCSVMSSVIAIQVLVLQPHKRQGGGTDMNKHSISPGKAQLDFQIPA